MLPGYRRCVSCRKVAPRQELWRIVRVFPSRTVQLDEGMGRSAYLCPQEDCLRKARQKNLLGRSLRTAIPDALLTQLGDRLISEG